MSRHANYLPHGVIPAVLLPFHEDLSIDEASYRSHLRDIRAVQGVTAITTKAKNRNSNHPMSQRRLVAGCRSFQVCVD